MRNSSGGIVFAGRAYVYNNGSFCKFPRAVLRPLQGVDRNSRLPYTVLQNRTPKKLSYTALECTGAAAPLASSGAGGALLHQYKHEMLPHTPAVSRSFPYGKGTWVCGYSQELGIYSILPCSSFSKNLYFAYSISVILFDSKFEFSLGLPVEASANQQLSVCDKNCVPIHCKNVSIDLNIRWDNGRPAPKACPPNASGW